MSRLLTDRRTLLKAGLAAPIALQVDSAAAVSLDLTMFGPERLFADVQSYAEAGNKQSGGAGDRWTADWTAKRLFSAGFEVDRQRSEEHTSELQSLMRISYAVFCLKKKTRFNTTRQQQNM